MAVMVAQHYFCLFVLFLFVCLFVCLFVFVCLFRGSDFCFLFVCLFVCLCCVCLFSGEAVCLIFCLFVYLFVYLVYVCLLNKPTAKQTYTKQTYRPDKQTYRSVYVCL